MNKKKTYYAEDVQNVRSYSLSELVEFKSQFLDISVGAMANPNPQNALIITTIDNEISRRINERNSEKNRCIAIATLTVASLTLIATIFFNICL